MAQPGGIVEYARHTLLSHYFSEHHPANLQSVAAKDGGIHRGTHGASDGGKLSGVAKQNQAATFAAIDILNKVFKEIGAATISVVARTAVAYHRCFVDDEHGVDKCVFRNVDRRTARQ